MRGVVEEREGTDSEMGEGYVSSMTSEMGRKIAAHSYVSDVLSSGGVLTPEPEEVKQDWRESFYQMVGR